MNKPVILITGALSGIGRASAVAFAKKGANIVVAGRRDEVGKALAEELRSFGSEAEFINADVRKEDDVRVLVDETVARFGLLDVAVNNAGTGGRPGPITDQTAETYAATFDTNVLGVILSMKHRVRAMQGQGSGSIICRQRQQRHHHPHRQLLPAAAARPERPAHPLPRRQPWGSSPVSRAVRQARQALPRLRVGVGEDQPRALAASSGPRCGNYEESWSSSS
ncbi:SDR family NAD(P)-dependent oxidoreductase [Streptomyces sp. NPDC001982]|uniref:SDR family NAD(P)-dependent oxidoreductase n=1 Tax=Streptomyces sp. NPDC001982 TaxID=3154405 RepID=UPI00331B837D